MAYSAGPHDQRIFETAVSSSASIVKPTVPKNVLAEFEHFANTGNRFRKANPFDDDEQPPAAPVPQRQAAPPPPQPVLAPTQPQQPARPVDFTQFGDFSIVQQPSTNQPKPAAMDDEKSRLIGTMQQYLRLKAAHGIAVTVGELSGQIRELTGQSWGGSWEWKYGNLMMFLKTNADAFSVVKSKYVTCKGQEDVAMRQLDREAQEQSAVIEEQQRRQAQYSTVPIYAQQPPPPQQTSYYAPSMDDPFGLNASSQYPWGAPPQSDRSSMASRRDSSDWALPPQPNNTFMPLDPFGNTDPYRGSEAPSYIPHATNTSSLDWWGAPPPMPPAPSRPADPFSMANMSASLGASSMTRGGKKASEDSDMSSSEDEAEVERRRRKSKRQEEEDEALARELQNKEFERSSEVKEDSGETIVLTTTQMRDLAEKELGIDNVRIIAGFTVKKYGREGRPHQRKMWVTQSLTHLAWASSLLEGSHRGIELKHVTDVASGMMTPTISRSTSDKNKVRTQCFSLITMSRTLDMQACSVIQRDALVNALKAVVEFNKKYKPEKVDRDLTKVKLVGFAPLFVSEKTSKRG